MAKKVYIFRVVNHNGRKEYKRTKCSNYWAADKKVCWRFSVQGAKKIIQTLTEYNTHNYYSFGIEIAE